MDKPWKKVGRVKWVTKPSEEEHDRKENATGEKKKKSARVMCIQKQNMGGVGDQKS